VDLHSRKQYLEEVGRESATAKKARRSELLDETEGRTKLNRKYLIRVLGGVLSGQTENRRQRRGRSYGVAVLSAPVDAWEMFDYPCGQRLQPVLR